MGWVYNVDGVVETNASSVVVVGVVFAILSFIVVLLRSYVRSYILKSITLDDWIIGITWFTSFNFMLLTLTQTRWGLGLVNGTTNPPQNVSPFGLLEFAGQPFFILSLLGFKLSLLLSLLRTAVDRTYRTTLIAIAATCTVLHIVVLIVQFNICHPIAKQFYSALRSGSCINSPSFYTIFAIFTIIFDIVLMISPLPMILHYPFSAIEVFFLSLIYALALFTTLIPLIRISTLKTLALNPYGSIYLTWPMVELYLGIIVVSLPSLAPLLRNFFNKGGLRAVSVQSYETHDSFWGAKSYLRRVREESSIWKRLVLVFGYGEFKDHRGMESQQTDLRSLGGRLESRAGSRSGRAGFSLGWLNGKSDEIDEEHALEGIMKTTEVVVSREEYGDHGMEVMRSVGADMSTPAPSRAGSEMRYEMYDNKRGLVRCIDECKD